MRLWLFGLVAVSVWANAQEAGPLPLTNVVGKTSFVLKQSASGNLNFIARPTVGAATGWLWWRGEIEDTKGKRHELGYGLRMYDGYSAAGPVKVTVFPDEILSVGFVAEPRAGEVVKLNVNARAAEFGLKDVFLLGVGDFVVGDAGDVARVEREGEGVRISADKPVVAVMYRPTAEIEKIDGRVRERSMARDGGKVFYSPRKREDISVGNGNVLRYAPVNWQQTTNRIEVEVMVRHRPVEFLVDFEKEKAGP